ncbi:unnamed protein product [Caenorhabditis sp. 36 PRJEB53466]|nr:unnamed protein product [Caenorhabditis sp. 36 PRJEB53466]
MKHLIFTVVLLGFFSAAVTEEVKLTKVSIFTNLDDTSRIFYTSLTKSKMLKRFNSSDYPIPKNLYFSMLAKLPANNSCPELREVHSAYDSYFGKYSFALADEIEYWGLKDFGVAGYLAPYPGYCNSDDIQLIELSSYYSNEYKYDTMNNIYEYYTDYDTFYQPTRILGYGFRTIRTNETVELTGTPPYINSRLSDNFKEPSIVNFKPVRILTLGNLTTYLVDEYAIEMTVADGWTLSPKHLPGPIYGNMDQDVRVAVANKCGKQLNCYEVRNMTTRITHFQNSPSPLGYMEMPMSVPGYFLSQKAAENCFPQASEYFSSRTTDSAYYGNYNDGTAKSVGYAYPYNFAFITLRIKRLVNVAKAARARRVQYDNATVIYANYNDNVDASANSVGFAFPYNFAFLKLE